MGGKFALFLFDIFLTLKHYNIGPYNDLYYIFASSKRPMRIWKRPIVFSMIYHQYQKRMKKSIGRLNNVYVYNVYHFKLISYGKKTYVVLQYFKTTYTLFKEIYA